MKTNEFKIEKVIRKLVEEWKASLGNPKYIIIEVTDQFIRMEDYTHLQDTVWIYYQRLEITGRGKNNKLTKDLLEFLKNKGVEIV